MPPPLAEEPEEETMEQADRIRHNLARRVFPGAVSAALAAATLAAGTRTASPQQVKYSSITRFSGTHLPAPRSPN